MIDGGVNVGLPYNGSKPDIGAYESASAAPTYYQVSLDASQASLTGKMAFGIPKNIAFISIK